MSLSTLSGRGRTAAIIKHIVHKRFDFGIANQSAEIKATIYEKTVFGEIFVSFVNTNSLSLQCCASHSRATS